MAALQDIMSGLAGLPGEISKQWPLEFDPNKIKSFLPYTTPGGAVADIGKRVSPLIGRAASAYWNAPGPDAQDMAKGVQARLRMAGLETNPPAGNSFVPSVNPTPVTSNPSPAIVSPNPVNTTLPAVRQPTQSFNEPAFQQWYGNWAKTSGMNPNPDDPHHFYDYRAAYNAGITPPEPGGHWPSQFKRPGHPNQFVNGIDTITGQPVQTEPKKVPLTDVLPPRPSYQMPPTQSIQRSMSDIIHGPGGGSWSMPGGDEFTKTVSPTGKVSYTGVGRTPTSQDEYQSNLKDTMRTMQSALMDEINNPSLKNRMRAETALHAFQMMGAMRQNFVPSFHALPVGVTGGTVSPTGEWKSTVDTMEPWREKLGATQNLANRKLAATDLRSMYNEYGKQWDVISKLKKDLMPNDIEGNKAVEKQLRDLTSNFYSGLGLTTAAGGKFSGLERVPVNFQVFAEDKAALLPKGTKVTPQMISQWRNEHQNLINVRKQIIDHLIAERSNQTQAPPVISTAQETLPLTPSNQYDQFGNSLSGE